MAIKSEALARDLSDLNAGFLSLVAHGADTGLPDDVTRRLRALAPEVRNRLAAAPFALFGFGFEDEAAWTRLLSPGVCDLDPGYVSREPPAERFTLLALAALRGFLRAAPRRVSAWMGLPTEVRTRLAEVEIGVLCAVAACAAPRLQGRFLAREYLWHRIIDAAACGDERDLRLQIALGKQWTIRRSLGLQEACATMRGFRR